MSKEKTILPSNTKSSPKPEGNSSIIGIAPVKTKNLKGTLKKLVKYLKPQYKGLVMVLLFAVFSTLFAVFGPKVLGLAIDKLYEGVVTKIGNPAASIDFRYIMYIIIILASIYLLSAICSFLQEYVMASVSQRIIQRMRNDVSEKLHRLPLSYFDTKTHGEILSRVTNDIDTISNTFNQSLMQIITAVLTLTGIIIMMLTINIWLTLVTFLILPVSLSITSFIARKSQKFYTGDQHTLGELNGYIEEMYGGHNVIKAYNYEQKTIDEFGVINQRLYSFGWKAQFVTSTIYPLLNFVGNLGFVAVCVLGGYLTAMGAITLGAVQAFISYTRQFNQPITQVSNIINVMQATIAASERVFEVLEEKEEVPDPVNPETIPDPKGAVKFNHVKFRYKPDTPLIEDLNIDVKAGQTTAIVGPTGAGKTTLVNLLMRFYELNGGSISIDAIDITHMKRKYLHLLFGMVLQDTWLFNGTIRDNIAYGKEGATDEEIIKASKMIMADDFIRTLPDGYLTIINEEGSNISEGQKQLLTIARAVLADPKLLILDEATSSVDTRTEALIQKAMKTLMKGRTNFVIAHRLSTIRDADSIWVMNQGIVIEQGTHQKLLDMKGFYYNLYNSQFS